MVGIASGMAIVSVVTVILISLSCLLELLKVDLLLLGFRASLCEF